MANLIRSTSILNAENLELGCIANADDYFYIHYALTFLKTNLCGSTR